VRPTASVRFTFKAPDAVFNTFATKEVVPAEGARQGECSLGGGDVHRSGHVDADLYLDYCGIWLEIEFLCLRGCKSYSVVPDLVPHHRYTEAA
jgi:hypothetical protein